MIAYLKENRTGETSKYLTVLEYSRVGNSLCFKFSCKDAKLFSAYSEDNDPIYEGDVCEVFLSTGGKINEYYEIEVAPNGATFFAKIVNENGLKTSFLQKNFTSNVTITEDGYDVEIIIPCDAIAIGKHPVYFNAYRIETDGPSSEQYLMALNPTLCEFFHKPESFIKFDLDV